MTKWTSILLDLTKFRISLFAALSASAGFILAKQELSGGIIPSVVGIFFLACGSCALNQYQERKLDAWMERTKDRPLPAGKLGPLTALRVSLGLITIGLIILFLGTGWVSSGLGLLAVIWYNGIYTYLKQKTAFAAIPGALVGVMPPVMGWASGGGHVFDARIGVVAFFFYLWQIPHFWLLLLNSGRDYDHAGLPSLSRLFTTEQLKRIIFIWMLSTAVSCLFIPLFGFVKFYVVHLLLLMAALWLGWNAMNFFKAPGKGVSIRFAFVRLNTYVLFVIAALYLDRFLDFTHSRTDLLHTMLAMLGLKAV